MEVACPTKGKTRHLYLAGGGERPVPGLGPCMEHRETGGGEMILPHRIPSPNNDCCRRILTGET